MGHNRRTPEESFAFHTERRGDCLIWTGALSPKGYGAIWVDGRTMRAHRFAWERVNGPLPRGAVVDHYVCHTPSCVEVAHLRPATDAQNQANRKGANRNSRSGIRGIRDCGTHWKVRVSKGGVEYGGRHELLEDALRERDALWAKHFGDFAGII